MGCFQKGLVMETHPVLLWERGFHEEVDWVGLPALWLTPKEPPSVSSSGTFSMQNWEDLRGNPAEMGNLRPRRGSNFADWSHVRLRSLL